MKERAREKARPSPVYDRFAKHYERLMAPLERRFLAGLRARVMAALPAEARVLEVGAGTGLNFPFYPRGARGAASELSREMLSIAHRKAERPASVHLVQTCAERLPFADASFDAAFATLVFCSVASPHEAFTELRRVVRPGGIVVLLEHVRPDGLLGYVFDALNVLTVALMEDHFNRRTAREAAQAGLHVERVERRAHGIINLIVCRNEGMRDERSASSS
ncbi:MAG TPA: methyltransferase domain-containing protein [Pyrinomonadaceae bacterium]|nr:methyltransferase domain-containing protein [Pyrinomonadaceae bacterium]